MQGYGIFRTDCQAFATAVAQIMIHMRLGPPSQLEFEADGLGVAGIATGPADDPAYAQAGGTDFSAPCPCQRRGRVGGIERTLAAAAEAVAAEITAFLLEAYFGIAAGAAHEQPSFAGADAVIAPCAAFDEERFRQRPGWAMGQIVATNISPQQLSPMKIRGFGSCPQHFNQVRQPVNSCY